MVAGQGNKGFIVPGLINIVVSANAGGAFSPFGDITTLMVWQEVLFHFLIFSISSYRLWLIVAIPAAIMYLRFLMKSQRNGKVIFEPGGNVIAFLGILTITITVSGHQVLHMPPVFGMMFGLGMLGTYGYFLKTRYPGKNKFDIFELTGKAEWDTLLFFYGILVCVGGLAALGVSKINF